jgi:hypothetical protein
MAVSTPPSAPGSLENSDKTIGKEKQIFSSSTLKLLIWAIV